MRTILATRAVRAVSICLLLEIVAFYSFPSTDILRPVRPLKELPQVAGAWSVASETPTETEILAVLKADDTLNRVYRNMAGEMVSLFIAFFKTQSTGVAPHSPRNCLPGSGWIPKEFQALPVNISGRAAPIVVNRYIIERGENRSLVLYWYQTGDRVVGNEYAAKLYTVSDRFFHRRSDTSLVRVLVPLSNRGASEAQDILSAQNQATELVRAIFPGLLQILPR